MDFLGLGLLSTLGGSTPIPKGAHVIIAAGFLGVQTQVLDFGE